MCFVNKAFVQSWSYTKNLEPPMTSILRIYCLCALFFLAGICVVLCLGSNQSAFRAIHIGMSLQEAKTILANNNIYCLSSSTPGNFGPGSDKCWFEDHWRWYFIEKDSQSQYILQKQFGFKRAGGPHNSSSR
jgi:hypothetical protein